MTQLTFTLKALLLITFSLLSSTICAQDKHPAEPGIRFAVLGDAEPKPVAEFPNLARAVDDVNRLASENKIDFVLGVGDIPHKGTMLQYNNVTPELQRLTLPFYPIMGNEEHGADDAVTRFLHFANLWNKGKTTIKSDKYVLEFDDLAIVLASPDHGRDFNNKGVAWVLEQLKQLNPKPVLLIVHGAQQGVYPENADKGISHAKFADVIAQPNLKAVISGDLHMDMDRVNHSKKIAKVHYLHIPALERTKIPDETRHNPMYRVFNISPAGEVEVATYAVGNQHALAEHSYQFNLGE
ncbi:metallophosphoesterase family protein [Pseudoalteromonas prydzensis]|jgi:Icc protein|uniref:metallophosphoesterase family protein n=1 Tax=Pseudoalteromonas prydzensis TaxID=182141 RepID=UPI003704D068